MRCYNPDEIDVAFDDERLVADAGLLLPATLAVGLGLRELVEEHVDLADASGRANAGDKAMTLIVSALAGGQWIDDCGKLRAGSTGRILGHRVAAPSTIGTFLRSFSWGSARQLDRVSAQTLRRAWAAGAGPGALPYTIDVDSTICEVYGLCKQGAAFGHTKVRGYHPLLAFGAGTGDLLHARLRGGNANSGRGAASFVTETINRIRAAGGRLGLLRPPGRQGLPASRGALLDHRQTHQGGAPRDPADPRGWLDADPVLAGRRR